jgi:glycosyltransferase involved in cell wall biosynthesis
MEEKKEGDEILQPTTTTKNKLKLDIVVPSLRCQAVALERFLKLKIPRNLLWNDFAVRVALDTDRPENIRCVKDLKRKYPHLHIVERRRREFPSGASATRNDGARDSLADWILFLDDDVSPRDNLLQVYAEMILKLSKQNDINGFVGLTDFHVPKTLFGLAVKSQGMISPFVVAREKRFPMWAPTSNLVLRRNQVRFDETLPKSGGSEDVELCARIYEKNDRRACLVSVPSAVVSHDLWRPSATMRRAFRWGASSVDLQMRHPNFTSRSYPDTIETILIYFMIWVFVSIFFYTSITLSWWWFTFVIGIVLTALHDVVIWITRIMSHMRFNQYSLVPSTEDGLIHPKIIGIRASDLTQVSKSDGGCVFYLCLVGVAILATIIDTTFLIGRLYSIFTKSKGWKCFFRNFDFTFCTEKRLPICLAFKDVVVRMFLIPTVCIVLGVHVSS